MNFDIETLTKFMEFAVAAVPVLGFLYGGWKMVIKPIRNIFKKIEELDENVKKEVLPVIYSIKKEFSENSGKSIMDRILRIDDNTRLAELRSKLIASNLLSTSILEFNKEGNLVWCNKAFTELTGLDSDNLHGRNWLMCVDEETRNHVVRLWNDSIKENIPFESEFNIKNQKTHQIKSVKCQVFPHQSSKKEASEILGYYGTIVFV
jgi:PAS domain S-box-containing protein